ncbi:MAG: hypothetical protein HUJ66_02285 [Oscillospiraceae bacterium]|nr:hypothetical protein [Oscillospiraceae bacterium]
MKLVFIGHSIVRGYPYDMIRSFPFVVGEILGEDCEVVNLGVNGETTAEILRRFDNEALSERPDAVFLMAGTNDFVFRTDNAEAAAELCRRMRLTAQEKGLRFVHVSPPPIDAELANDAWLGTGIAVYRMAQEDLGEFSELLRLDAEQSGCGFVDCFHGYAAYDRYADGLHPTAEGQRLIARLCLEWIKANM